MPKECSVEGCHREVRIRGFCNPHYLRYKRYGDPLAGGAFRERALPKKCAVDGCSSESVAYGYCSKHAHKFVRYGTPTPPIKQFEKDKECSVDGCHGLRVGNGLCRKHYGRLKAHGSLESTKTELGFAKQHRKEYSIYLGMKRRCYNSKNRAYPNYGGRGIKVCDRWLGPDGFKNFLEDMGERPSLDYSLDRINNDGDYCPENCRWATRKQQANNKRNNIIVDVFGEKHTLSQWSREIGINEFTLRARYKRGDRGAFLLRTNAS